MGKEKKHCRTRSGVLSVAMKPEKRSHHTLKGIVKNGTSLESLQQGNQTSENEGIFEVNIVSLKRSHKKEVKKHYDEEETSETDAVCLEKVLLNSEVNQAVQDGKSSKWKSRKNIIGTFTVESVDQHMSLRSSKKKHDSGCDEHENPSPTQRSSKLCPLKARLGMYGAETMKKRSKSLNVTDELVELPSSSRRGSSEGKKKKKKKEELLSDVYKDQQLECAEISSKEKRKKNKLSESQEIQDKVFQPVHEDPDIQFLQNNSSKKRTSSRGKSKKKDDSEVLTNTNSGMSSMEIDEEQTVEQESEFVQVEGEEITKKKKKKKEKKKKREKSGEDETFGGDSECVVLCDVEDESTEVSTSKKSRKKTRRKYSSMEVVEIVDKTNDQNEDSRSSNGVEFLNPSNPYGACFVVTEFDKYEKSQGKLLPWETSGEISEVPVEQNEKNESGKNNQEMSNDVPSTSRKLRKRVCKSKEIPSVQQEEKEDSDIQLLQINTLEEETSSKDKSKQKYANFCKSSMVVGEQQVDQETVTPIEGEETTKKKKKEKKREKPGEDQSFGAECECVALNDVEDGNTDLSSSKKSKKRLSESQQIQPVHQEEKEDPGIQFLQINTFEEGTSSKDKSKEKYANFCKSSMVVIGEQLVERETVVMQEENKDTDIQFLDNTKTRRSSRDKSKRSYASEINTNGNFVIAEEQTEEQESEVVQIEDEEISKKKKKKKRREKSDEDETIGASACVSLYDSQDGSTELSTSKKLKKRLSQQVQPVHQEENEDPDIQVLENSTKKRCSSRGKSKKKDVSLALANGISPVGIDEEQAVEQETEVVVLEDEEATKKKKKKRREKSTGSECVTLCDLEDGSIEQNTSKKLRKKTSRKSSMESVEIQNEANNNNQDSSNCNGVEFLNPSNPYGARFVVTEYDKYQKSQGNVLPWETSVETSEVPVELKQKRKSRKSKQDLSNDMEELGVSVQGHEVDCELIDLSQNENSGETECEETKESFSRIREYEDNLLSFHFYELEDGKVILVLKDQNPIYFRGKLKVSIIWGSLDVLGYTMKYSSKKTHTVFSSKMYSFLCLESKGEELESVKKAKKRLIAAGMSKTEAKQLVSNIKAKNVIVLLEKTESAVTEFLEKYWKHLLSYEKGPNQKGPLRDVEKKLNCNLVTSQWKETPHMIVKSSEWDMLADDLVDSSQFVRMCLVVCGGKGVGKSTLLRYLINRYLGVYEEIVFLDFDPGQAEFTVPGCVSAVLVNEPLLGPNFTHLRKPERMLYVGDIDISQCPDRYIECAKDIFSFCKTDPRLSKLPWFINTMGFNQGLGVDLTVDIIRMANPTHLVQIHSQKKKLNFPMQLSPHHVFYHNGMRCSIPSLQDEMQYAFYHVQSLTGGNPNGKTKPSVFRELVTMAYLSEMVKPPNYCVSEVTPHKIEFSSLLVSIAHERVHPQQVLNVLDGSLVGLCTVDETQVDFHEEEDDDLPKICVHPPISPCIGFGIIHGIDVETKQVHLVTPLTAEELQPVNCLMMGAIGVPPCLSLSRTSRSKPQKERPIKISVC